MKHQLNFIYLLAFVLVLLSTGCKDPETPVDPNEEELITKVELQFTALGGATQSYVYNDPDGDGGNNPVRFDTIRLDSGASYQVRVLLYDESDPNNVANITDEVQAEAAEHLFCFTPSGVNVGISLTDSDGTFPIGIESSWVAAAPSTGTVRVELRHQPDGQKDGTCVPGATDLQLDFVTIVE